MWKLAWTVAERGPLLSLPRQMYAKRVAGHLDRLGGRVWEVAPAQAAPIWKECMKLSQMLAAEAPNSFRLKYARSAYKLRRYSEMSGDIDPSPEASSSERPHPKRSSSLFIHLDVLPILSFPMEKFCSDILNGTFAEGNAVIRTLKRRQHRSGVRHEFLIIQAESDKAGEFWIRIDRAASTSSMLAFRSVSSLFPAKDSVLIAKTELELINYAHTDAEYKMEIDFPKVDDVKFAPTLHHLVVILGVVQEVSPKYNPIKENCWFLASIVEEALHEMFDGKPREPVGTRWAEEVAPKAREDVLSRLYWNSK